MFEMGLIVALGIIVTMFKVSWKTKVWMTSHPVLMDVVIFVALTLIHWGTFTGVMVATIGAFVCSIVLSMARLLFGFKRNGVYHQGYINVAHKL